ncbi:MAG: HEPN domain-containing protein [Candidatus Micrarchaeaceae archaeon]
MENMTAIENAKVWLETAEAAMRSRIYPTALYSMEMAVEIALKAVLMEFGVNVPKVHNITNLLREELDEKERLLPKEFIENKEFIFSTYNDLLEIRPLVGYAFEINTASVSEEKSKKYMKSAEKVVSLCKIAVEHISKKRRN